MAEWLGTGLQNLLQRFDSASHLSLYEAGPRVGLDLSCQRPVPPRLVPPPPAQRLPSPDFGCKTPEIAPKRSSRNVSGAKTPFLHPKVHWLPD